MAAFVIQTTWSGYKPYKFRTIKVAAWFSTRIHEINWGQAKADVDYERLFMHGKNMWGQNFRKFLGIEWRLLYIKTKSVNPFKKIIQHDELSGEKTERKLQRMN